MYSLQKLTKLHWLLTMIKKIQSVDSIKTYQYGTKKEMKHKKEKNKCIDIIKHIKIINYDDVTKKNIKQQNLNLPKILIIHTIYK